MAEPSGSLKISDLVIEVARDSGLAFYGVNGDEIALVPVNQHDLYMCRNIVNNAIRRFIMDAPDVGWRWPRRIMSIPLRIASSATATAANATSITNSGLALTYADDYYNDCIIEIVGGTGRGENALVTDYDGTAGTFTFSALSGGTTPDTTTVYLVGHRYKLADDFGGTPDGDITYAPQSNRGATLEWRHESFMRELRENTTITSHPLYAAIRPFGRRQYEFILWPSPSQDVVIEFPYTMFFDAMEIESGTATAGEATSLTVGALAGVYVDDYFNSWTMTVISGTGKGGTATVTDYTGSSGKFDYTAGLSNSATPDTTSKFMVEPENDTHPAGYQFDEVIRIACKGQVEQDIEDKGAGWLETYLNIALARARKLDARLAPRKLGRPNERIIGRTWNDVTHN